jgi:hypothetical protein
MNKPLRKRRTREHIIADLSVNHVERHTLLCGFVVQVLFRDYGIDLELYTFNKKGEAQAEAILLQLKASDQLRLRKGQAPFRFRVERRARARWLAEPMPVILIVYDARKETAYWLYIQSYFRWQEDFNIFAAGKTVTVTVPTGNVVDTSAMRRFARFRDRVLDQTQEITHDEE